MQQPNKNSIIESTFCEPKLFLNNLPYSTFLPSNGLPINALQNGLTSFNVPNTFRTLNLTQHQTYPQIASVTHYPHLVQNLNTSLINPLVQNNQQQLVQVLLENDEVLTLTLDQYHHLTNGFTKGPIPQYLQQSSLLQLNNLNQLASSQVSSNISGIYSNLTTNSLNTVITCNVNNENSHLSPIEHISPSGIVLNNVISNFSEKTTLKSDFNDKKFKNIHLNEGELDEEELDEQEVENEEVEEIEEIEEDEEVEEIEEIEEVEEVEDEETNDEETNEEEQKFLNKNKIYIKEDKNENLNTNMSILSNSQNNSSRESFNYSSSDNETDRSGTCNETIIKIIDKCNKKNEKQTIDTPVGPYLNKIKKEKFEDSKNNKKIVDGVDISEIEEFARYFKIYRAKKGLTQTQICEALDATKGPRYSQSAICRFENLDVTPKSAQKIKPVLEKYILETENLENSTSFEFDSKPKIRKKRTCFSHEATQTLAEYFKINRNPSISEIEELSKKLNYTDQEIKVWFCNKRQSIKKVKKS